MAPASVAACDRGAGRRGGGGAGILRAPDQRLGVVGVCRRRACGQRRTRPDDRRAHARRLRRRADRIAGARRRGAAWPVRWWSSTSRRAPRPAPTRCRCACSASTRCKWPASRRRCCRGWMPRRTAWRCSIPTPSFANATALQRLNVRSGDFDRAARPRGLAAAASRRHGGGGRPCAAGGRHRGGAVAAGHGRAPVAHRSASDARRRGRALAARAPMARRRARGRRRRGRAAGVESVARLSREPERAGAGGAAGRRLPRLLGARVVGGAAHADLRAARRARPDRARTPRLGARRGVVHRRRRQRARVGGRRRRWPGSRCAPSVATWAAAISRAPRRACRSVCGQRCCMAHWVSPPPWAAPGGRRVRPNGWHRRRR